MKLFSAVVLCISLLAGSRAQTTPGVVLSGTLSVPLPNTEASTAVNVAASVPQAVVLPAPISEQLIQGAVAAASNLQASQPNVQLQVSQPNVQLQGGNAAEWISTVPNPEFRLTVKQRMALMRQLMAERKAMVLNEVRGAHQAMREQVAHNIRQRLPLARPAVLLHSGIPASGPSTIGLVSQPGPISAPTDAQLTVSIPSPVVIPSTVSIPAPALPLSASGSVVLS